MKKKKSPKRFKMGKREVEKIKKVEKMKKMVLEAVEDEEECRKAKYIIIAILVMLGAGPLLGLTIQEVCISKCLLSRRLPQLGREFEDTVVVALFLFYVILNYVILAVIWTLFRKTLRTCYLSWLRMNTKMSMPSCVMRWILMDPKTTRSGKVYGYRKAKYVNSDIRANKR
ncbi:uncharacterized protein [Littorina saxatilis]|uniref:Uncharacterized protein n=1 Tax=Littorina saxatilis TaxID=31220 RepID=A0AAN9AZC3_9CAEN